MHKPETPQERMQTALDGLAKKHERLGSRLMIRNKIEEKKGTVDADMEQAAKNQFHNQQRERMLQRRATERRNRE